MYADQLLSKGHRLGELVALELAMPPAPSPETLSAFHALARRVCHASRWLEVGWCLGHARSLSIRRELPRASLRHAVSWIPDGALVVARDFLRSPQGQTIEHFSSHLPLFTARSDPWWQRVMAALPPSCTQTVLGLPEQTDGAGARAILESLPRSVHSLGLWSPRLGRSELRPELFVDDRLAWLDLSWWMPTPQGLGALYAALERTARVRVRLPSITGAVPPAVEPRLTLGEAGFLAEGQGACVLPRWPLRLLQRHHGIVGVRAQLGRLVAERYDLDHPEAGRLGASFKEGNALVRHGSGEWTARSSHSLPLRKNGVALATGALPVALRDGDTVHIGGDPTPWRFLSRGLDEAFHRAQYPYPRGD